MSVLKQPQTPRTNPVLKKVLIAFLILCAIGGIAFQIVGFASIRGSFLSGKFLSTNSMFEALPISKSSFDALPEFFETGRHSLTPSARYTFQGTLTGETGSIALINGEMAAVGAAIDGVTIVSISNKTLIIERKGQPVMLTIGESFEPASD
jgi:hypothetical protein